MIPQTLLTILFLAAASITHAEAPTIVELFTSKYCPSCPGVERYLQTEATENPNLMVIMENVDYWDRPGQTDPHGNPDFTQRQYDYSNLLAERPGQVFTPQPIINGVEVAEPPMFLNWSASLTKGQHHTPTPLGITTTQTGGVIISLPSGMKVDANHEIYLISMNHEEGGPLWRAKGVISIGGQGDTIALTKAQLPAGGTHILALLQLMGPGKVVAAGVTKR